jgi:hypothetical protein
MYHSLLLVLLYSWCVPVYYFSESSRFPTSESISTMSNHVSALRSLDINIAAYSSGRDQMLIVYDGVDGFVEALDSMADECNLHLYKGVLYNMPYKVLASPPYYCVSIGPYIGVFTLYLWYVCYHLLPKTLLILH